MFSVVRKGANAPAHREGLVRIMNGGSDVGKNKKMIVDTGSSVEGVLMPAIEERNMYNRKPSTLKCRAANGELLKVGLEGLIDIKCPGHDGGAIDIKGLSSHSSSELSQYILGVHPLFSTGNWDFLWRAKSRGGCAMIKYKDGTNKIEKVVPLEYCELDRTTYLNFESDKVASEANRVIEEYRKRGKVAIVKKDIEALTTLCEVPVIEYLLHSERGEVTDIGEKVLALKGGEEFSLEGTKRNLKKDKRVMPRKTFSATHGHLGCSGLNCEICRRKAGNRKGPENLVHAKHKEKKRGFRWRLDVCTWDVRNLEGDKYAFVLRDAASKAFHIITTTYRDDFTELFIEWVETLRAAPHAKEAEHQMVSYIKTDFDGVWREDVKEFQSKMNALGVVFTYSPPEKKEGGAESNINVYEQTVKAVLMERNLPGQYWGQASRDAEFLMNRFPTIDSIKSPDGDTVLPLEYLTGGFKSRAELNRELNAYVTLGSVCLVHDQSKKGSDSGSKIKIGISWGMVGEVNRFKCPYRGNIFRSSSFTVVGLPNNISYSQFLNLPDFQNKNCQGRVQDFKVDWSEVTHTPEPRTWVRDYITDIKMTDWKEGVEIDGESEFYIARKKNPQLPQQDYVLHDKAYIGRKVEKSFRGYEVPFKGVVTNHDFDSEDGNSIWEVTFEDGDVGWYNHLELMGTLQPQAGGGEDCEEGARGENDLAQVRTIIERAIKQEGDYHSKSSDTFQQVCNKLGLPKAWYRTYYFWLTEQERKELQYPFEKGKKNNLKVPVKWWRNPRGDSKFCSMIERVWKRNNQSESVYLTTKEVELISSGGYRNQPEGYCNSNEVAGEKGGGCMILVEKSSGKVLHVCNNNERITPPETVQDAVGRGDIELLVEAWDLEMESLGEYGAVTHNHTKEELKRMGINTPPIPTRMISDVKYSDGKFSKYKGVCVAQGFRMIKGVHYDGKTFSPTPNQYTNKILMGIKAGERLECISFDIKLAYTWGEREGNYKLAMSYPKGFKRYDNNGEELFMVSHRSQYGMAPAGREWFKTRQDKLLKLFNNKEYSAHVTKSDPCLMNIIYWPRGKPEGFKAREVDIEVRDPDDHNIPKPTFKTINEIKEGEGNFII